MTTAPDASYSAASRGHMDIVRWVQELRSQGADSIAATHDHFALEGAITLGHFEIAKFLVEHDHFFVLSNLQR